MIRDGGLIGLPTDTVYGLAADATSDAAVAGVFRAKGRPADKPLIALVASMTMSKTCADLTASALSLAEAFWPGPLTLVLPRAAGSPLSPLVHQGAPGVSLRIPGNEAARAVVEAAERPLTAPSANPSGAPSPLTAAEVAAGLGARDRADHRRRPEPPIVSALPCSTSPETSARLLRAGVVRAEAIEGVIGPIARAN